MEFHKIIKDTIKEHSKKIELIQWAITSGIASLVYSEYIRNIRQKRVPTRIIFVPQIRRVQELLNPDGEFMNSLSESLIDNMRNHELFKQYKDAPELVLFNDDNIDTLKTIFDLYIIPNIFRSIPETISKKFDLQNPQQQLIRESNEIDIFDRKPIQQYQFDYIVEESLLQLLVMMPTVKKEVIIPESNIKLHMSENEILSIGHQSAICNIYINKNIIENEEIIKLIKFVSNTNIKQIDIGDDMCIKGDDIVKYIITSDVFNQLSFTKLIGIDNNIK